MSVRFAVNGASVWWPASAVARLFKAQAEVAAAALDIPTGLGEVFADEVVIDLPVFEEFVKKLARQYNAPYYVVHSLATGVFGTSYVMVERAGGQLPEIDPGRAAVWETQHLEFARSMPK
jgi:Family of unknown function (DUF6086)